MARAFRQRQVRSRRGLTGVLALLATMLAAPAGHAASQDRTNPAWQACLDSDPHTAIAGCTVLLRPGREQAADRAIAAFDRGNAWRAKGDLRRAIADYSLAIRLKPDFPGALVNRGIAWYQLRRFDRAVADYDAAIRLRPDLPEAWNNRALAWHKLGDYARAKADFDRTIQLNQNYGNALINRALPSSPPGPRP